MSQTVLFLCPHAAAKSVIAVADFQELAQQQGLDWQAVAAGTEPEARVSPVVVDLLRVEGKDVSQHRPRRVTLDELATASRIISMGCDLNGLVSSDISVTRWDDVPAVSVDPPAARAEIRARVERLILELRAA
jgi:protein-tyrosine-phosphatase